MSLVRKVLTDAELLEYSEKHLLYEIAMCFKAGLLLVDFGLMDPVPELAREVARMALIESFAIHLRNLIDFFYPAKVFDTDVLAEDFFVARALPKNFPVLSVSLESARNRASKEVSHLTTERIAGTPPKKSWPVAELSREMRALLVQFVREASPARLHAEIGEFVNAQREPNVLVLRSTDMTTTTSSVSHIMTVGWKPTK